MINKKMIKRNLECLKVGIGFEKKLFLQNPTSLNVQRFNFTLNVFQFR